MDKFHLSERECVAQAIEAASACKTLPELYTAIEAYEGHPIARDKHYTPSQIAKRKDDTIGPIMIVSEKPEDKDIVEGRPFSGEYGSVMRNAARQAGVDLDAVHIAYAVHWLPSKEKSPNKTQIAASRPFLFKEIELVKPRAILAQGKGVMEALAGWRGNILEVAGQTMQFQHGDIKIPMFIHTHPKYCLFNGTHFVDFGINLKEFFQQHGLEEEGTAPGSFEVPVASLEIGYEPVFKRIEDMKKKAA